MSNSTARWTLATALVLIACGEGALGDPHQTPGSGGAPPGPASASTAASGVASGADATAGMGGASTTSSDAAGTGAESSGAGAQGGATSAGAGGGGDGGQSNPKPGAKPAGCLPSSDPGCNGCACEACVCAKDPYCCNKLWDSTCINLCVGCGTKCKQDLVDGSSPPAGPCEEDADSAPGYGAQCLPPCATNFPAGLCGVLAPGESNCKVQCPAETACVVFTVTNVYHPGVCLQQCQSDADCRECYECSAGPPKVCVPTGICLQANAMCAGGL
jgi:hypothetical protein